MKNSSIFNYAVLNGILLPVNEARISIFNPAFFSSFGVYESIKIDQGRPFFLEEHLYRLLNSAQMIDLGLGVDVDTLVQWFLQLVQVDRQATWSLKIIALGTTEPSDQPTVAMQPTQLPSYSADYYSKGGAATLYEGQRVMPACKSLNTLVNYLARHKARQAGALEGLLHYNGYLTEGARSNLFAVQQGVLLTPPTGHVLSGITREVIMQVMQEAGQPVIEAPVSVDLSLYDEFFISSTSMHVMPITHIDQEPVGSGRVGPLTRLAMAKFNEYYQSYMKSTPVVVN